jgi:sugar/nucleoside kinase (ribokinase family)
MPTHVAQVEVKDTVGCGDSFAAAVVLGYISQHSIPSTLVLANAVGAATAMGRGAGTNVASASLVSDWGVVQACEWPEHLACCTHAVCAS